MTRTQKLVAAALILVGLLAALWVAVGRVMVEQTNRTVGITVDWEVRAPPPPGSPPARSPATRRAPHHAPGDAEMALAGVIARGETALSAAGTWSDWADIPPRSTRSPRPGRACPPALPAYREPRWGGRLTCPPPWRTRR